MRNFIRIYLTGLVFLISLLAGQEKHVIVFTDGSTRIAHIDSSNRDSTVYLDLDRDTTFSTNHDNIYLIYSNFKRIFYYSPSLLTRLNQAEERGGIVVTQNLDTLHYNRIRFDRHMIHPQAFLYTENEKFPRIIDFLDIYLIRSDATVMEHSVWKGFITSGGLFLAGTTLEILGDWRKSSKNEKLVSGAMFMNLFSSITSNTQDLLPKLTVAGLDNTGVTYHSMTFFIPLTTMGWMVYDFLFDKRTHYIRPRSRAEHFSLDMRIIPLKERIKTLIN